jgi:predicted glycosyltransferase
LKIVIDILTPKQCMFFSNLSDEMEKRGHQVFKTTRKYREVLQLLKLKRIEAKVVGEHGGKELMGKLKASAQRTVELASFFKDLKPDVAVSFSSPEMARVSYGLKVPHICINDSPHAEAVARLTVPLSERLLTPKMIPKKAWTRFGIPEESIVQYNALDPWVWLKDFKLDTRILQQLGLDESKPILTFRTEETFAAYLLGKTQEKTSVIGIIEELIEASEPVQIVAVPRYKEQVKALREVFEDRIFICGSTVDGPSLLHYTSIFIGAGGTMTTEAALLGVPTFSCYPDKPFLILKYLIGKKLVTRETDPEKLGRRILATLGDLCYEKTRQAEKARRLIQDFEDPVDIIVEEVEGFA